MGKILVNLTSTCLSELLPAEYLREANISIFISHLLFFFSLDALKKSSKKKETRIKMEIVELSNNKLVTVERDQDDEILGFDLVFVG